MQKPEKRPPRQTIVISARLDLNSEAGRIYQHLVDEGWQMGDIIEQALLAANGDMPKRDSMDERTIIELTNAIQRLEALAERLMTGATLTPVQQAQASKYGLEPAFVQSARRLARPGFRPGE